jgi:YidC/Oxa1 family membrane protein insertase
MDFLTNPFATALLFLYQLLGGNIILTIIIFTVIIRFLVFPLTWQQLKSSREMQKIQPEMKEMREKYKNDREKMAQAQMDLYRKHGINPFAGCLPLIVQLPILLGLYGAITIALATSPLQVLDVSHRLLVPSLASLIPLQNRFLIWNLGQPDTTFILPIIVVATTWLQQKLIMPVNANADPKDPSVQMSRQMTIMMPLMIGFFSIQFASGLSIYWIVGNIIGIVQYALLGKVDVRAAFGLKKPEPALATANSAPVPRPTSETMRRSSGKATEIDAKPAKPAARSAARAVNKPAKGTPKPSVEAAKPVTDLPATVTPVATNTQPQVTTTTQSFDAVPARPRAKAKPRKQE